MNQKLLSSFSFSFPLLPSLLLVLLAIASASNNPNIIHQTCNRCAQTDPGLNANVCIFLLSSNPNARHADITGLGVISLGIARAKAVRIQYHVQNLLKSFSGGGKKYEKGCFEDCLEMYTDAVFQLRDSAVALRMGHIADARTWISAALDAATTCEDGFQEAGLRSPLKKLNDDYRNTVCIPLDIAALLDHNI